MAKKDTKRAPASLVNRRAEHEYYFIQKYEAGIQLVGSEVKSLREGKANLTEAYCMFKDDELYVRNLHISEYLSSGGFSLYDSLRMRKLLLKKAELRKIKRQLSEKGRTVVPYRIYFNERGFAKMEICVAAGKKNYDKRETMKARDSRRELDRIKKQYQL